MRVWIDGSGTIWFSKIGRDGKVFWRADDPMSSWTHLPNLPYSHWVDVTTLEWVFDMETG